MDTQQAVLDQIVQNLAFDVEAIPKNKSMQSISQSTPLNVKIKVRKKDEIQKHHDISNDDMSKTVQKVRLVNSDQTIMTFDVFMEAEFEKKPRKLHKQLFDMLRPGICLGAVDNDKYPYMPSSSYSANITEPTKVTKSDGTFKQTFTLSKNVYQDYSVSTQQGGPKWLFGKCKPGGCLDPPFSEDKYSYKPSTRSGPEREEEEELLDAENVGTDVNSNKKPIILNDEETQSNGRHSSIFDSGLFKKKRRSSEKSTNTNIPNKTDSIVDIYHGESSTNSAGTRSNSIITYPPKTKSVPRMSDDKTVRSRGPSEDKPKKSFNDHSEPYFIPPKGINRIKEQDTLDPSDYPKHRSSDATKLRHPSEKESLKMPIPIPVPIPIMSSTRKPEDIDLNDDILATQGDNANVTEFPKQESQEQELPEKMNLRDAATPQLLRKKSGTDDKHVESSKMESFASNVEPPNAQNELGYKTMDESKLQPFEEIDRKNNMEDIGLPHKNEKKESLRMPMPLPISIPVPFNISDPAAAAVDSETKNENLKTSDMNLSQSKQSFQTPTIKDKHFEDSKDMQKNIDPENRSVKNESTSNATPQSQYSDIEADTIPKDYLRTRGGFSDQESDTKTQEHETVTKPPIIADPREKRDSKVEEITESNDKPTKQNNIKDEDTTATKDEPKKGERKDSKRISQSKLPILQKSMSLLSGSKSPTDSAKYKKDSPDKYLDKVGDKDTDLGSLLSGSKTSTASAKNKRDTKRSDSPDKYSDKVGNKGTDLGSLLSGSKTSTASAKDKRDTTRSDSSDKYSDIVGDKGTDLGSLLSGCKTSTASAKDKRDTTRSDSSDKYSDIVGDKGTDLGSLLSGSKTSTASAKDKRDTTRSDSSDKYSDIVGDKGTDLGSLLSGSKTSTASAKDKRGTTRSDSSDIYSDKVGDKGTDLGSLLSGSKTSTASAKDKRDTTRSDSSDKYSDIVGDKGTDLGSLLSGSKTSTASAKDKRDTTRSDSSGKYSDKVGDKGTDLGSLRNGSKTSTASTKDNRDKRKSFSPDKYLDNVGDRDTDSSIRKDESLPSGLKYESNSGDGKITEPISDKEYVDEMSEPNNDDNIDFYTKGQARFPNDENVNFIAAPVIIDNTELSPKSGKLKEGDGETKILGEPMNTDREYDPREIPFTTQIASRFRETDGDETHSTKSCELIGTQSVVYDTDELIPSMSAQKHTDRIMNYEDSRLSSIQSTSTLKIALKEDLISVDLGFHSYLNDKNERILRTFDAANSPKRSTNDSVTVLKTQMRISSNEIRIPVDSEHDMSIQIKKSNAKRVSISKSGFVNDIDSRIKKQKTPVLSSDAELRSSEAKVEERQDSILESDATDDHFTEYYEKELVPLQITIKNLRNEIDVLAAQQVVFKDKLFCSNNALFAQNKSKLPRLVHSNKKCYGCVRK